MNANRRIVISIDDQTLALIEDDEVAARYAISSGAKGVGFVEGSYRTPTGRFRIAEKIGAGEASGTIFQARVPVGLWNPGKGCEKDYILSRILWLEGTDEENANTLERYIYIHGTADEATLGRPASHGCIRLSNEDVIDLFNRVAVGDEVEIAPPTLQRGKILFIDCDSTLSYIEGIDELARARGEEVFARVAALTDAAMNGEIPIHEVFPKRMEIIRPDRETCERVADLYIEKMVPGAVEFIREARRLGWLPVILSGGFAPLIHPLAKVLGVEHVEAVPLFFDENGVYQGYGTDYPTTRNLGKNEVIREWRKAMLPEKTAMIGDGVSDLETKQDVDVFIGFAGVVERPKVLEKADFRMNDLRDITLLQSALS